MQGKTWLRIAAILFVSASASGQTDQASTPPQSAVQAPATKTSPAQPTNDKCPCKPWTVVDAANAAKQRAESEPPAKIYKNKDLKDPADPNSPAPGVPPSAAHLTPASTSQQKDSPPPSVPVQSPASFKAQGEVYRNQILLEKEKVADIQSRIADLKYQFDTWSTSMAQDPTDASICWTAYATPYYKDWCDTGRSIKTQYDAAEGQLKKENANLEKMQENIRRKGYGNAVYDPELP